MPPGFFPSAICADSIRTLPPKYQHERFCYFDSAILAVTIALCEPRFRGCSGRTVVQGAVSGRVRGRQPECFGGSTRRRRCAEGVVAVILPDLNLLLYAYDPHARDHKRAHSWRESTFRGSEIIGLPDEIIPASYAWPSIRGWPRMPRLPPMRWKTGPPFAATTPISRAFPGWTGKIRCSGTETAAPAGFV